MKWGLNSSSSSDSSPACYIGHLNWNDGGSIPPPVQRFLSVLGQDTVPLSAPIELSVLVTTHKQGLAQG